MFIKLTAAVVTDDRKPKDRDTTVDYIVEAEAHHMCFTQRQLFEHFVSDGRIGDVDDERHALLAENCASAPGANVTYVVGGFQGVKVRRTSLNAQQRAQL